MCDCVYVCVCMCVCVFDECQISKVNQKCVQRKARVSASSTRGVGGAARRGVARRGVFVQWCQLKCWSVYMT